MIVVDSSVALKWFVPETGSDAAAGLIGSSLIAPALLLIECGNAFWKKIARGEETAENARIALENLPRFVAIEPDEPLVQAAFTLAVELRHPIYDCLFLALAERRNVPFATADERLIARCAGTRFEERFHTWRARIT